MIGFTNFSAVKTALPCKKCGEKPKYNLSISSLGCDNCGEFLKPHFETVEQLVKRWNKLNEPIQLEGE